jgi:hypothetical protein
MRTGDTKTMFQIIIGARQVRHIIAVKEPRSKVCCFLHEVIESCAECAQTRLLLLHVLHPGQIGLPNLGARLLLVIGQDVSGLIDQVHKHL